MENVIVDAMNTHTPECLKQQAEYEVALRAWHEKWPNACMRCGGLGVFARSGSFYEPPSVDPCSGCSEVGRCGRCGFQIIGENEDCPNGLDCPQCGWNDHGQTLDMSEPDGMDGPCDCFDDEIAFEDSRELPDDERRAQALDEIAFGKSRPMPS